MVDALADRYVRRGIGHKAGMVTRGYRRLPWVTTPYLEVATRLPPDDWETGFFTTGYSKYTESGSYRRKTEIAEI